MIDDVEMSIQNKTVPGSSRHQQIKKVMFQYKRFVTLLVQTWKRSAIGKRTPDTKCAQSASEPPVSVSLRGLRCPRLSAGRPAARLTAVIGRRK